ncbi:MAG: T9SS type A sorting domain-containing protein [Candidatus Cloacimonetes bacterium]|nr:T9SS type A sorting domain-containing protein [Candidatus Cloacimonadota bacterium]
MYTWNIAVGDVGIKDFDIVPSTTCLISCFPNPFNPETFINFSVKAGETVLLEIFNIQGQIIRRYSAFSAGNHQIRWNGTDSKGNRVSSGLFFYRLESESVQQVRKMLLLK